MKLTEYKYLVGTDLYRYTGKANPRKFAYAFLRHPGFNYTFWLRTCAYFSSKGVPLTFFFFISRIFLENCKFKYGISIPWKTRIGSGFYIGHFGDIVVNGDTIIGKNCNISQGVTLGIKNRGEHQGCPIIHDNVYIGPGAKVIGKVEIGNNVAIGANAVVTKDIPDFSVAVGIPAKVISDRGSEGYINRTDYS